MSPQDEKDIFELEGSGLDPEEEAEIVRKTFHTRFGKADGPWPYGATHDANCPGCMDTPYTASPRSEAYWSS